MMRYGAPDGHGRYGMLDTDPEGRLICHECGQARQQLATHARQAHGIDATEYRQAHGLGSTTPLMSKQLRERLAAAFEVHRDLHLAALDGTRNAAVAAARSLSHRGGQWAPEVRAKRQMLGRANRSADLTEMQKAFLGDGVDLQTWADRARRLIERDGVTMSALGRAEDVSPAAVAERLKRYPPR